MNEDITIRIEVRTNVVGSLCAVSVDVPKNDWEDMTDGQKEDYCREVMYEMIEWGYEVV